MSDDHTETSGHQNDASGRDKRRKCRADVDQHIEVKNVLLDSSLGKIVNVSEDGFMIIGDAHVKENNIYQLSLSFTRPVNDAFHLSLGAECLWLNETGTGEQVWAGFQVIDISEKDKEIFDKLSSEVD